MLTAKYFLSFCIRESSLTQEDFDKIGEKHLNAMARIKDIESYRFNLKKPDTETTLFFVQYEQMFTGTLFDN